MRGLLHLSLRLIPAVLSASSLADESLSRLLTSDLPAIYLRLRDGETCSHCSASITDSDRGKIDSAVNETIQHAPSTLVQPWIEEFRKIEEEQTQQAEADRQRQAAAQAQQRMNQRQRRTMQNPRTITPMHPPARSITVPLTRQPNTPTRSIPPTNGSAFDGRNQQQQQQQQRATPFADRRH